MSKSTSSTFSEISLIKKLQNVTNTQDSIQTLSLWVLHHKAYYKQIVDQWLKCYLKGILTIDVFPNKQNYFTF